MNCIKYYSITIIFSLLLNICECENGPFGTGPIIFVATGYNPMVICNETSTEPYYVNETEGASLYFLRKLIKEMNWTQSDYEFRCLDWSYMFELIQQNSNVVGLGGITITYQRVQRGYKFSYPSFQAGFSILIKDEKLNLQFLSPLTLQFVGILLSTVVASAIIIYFFDRIEHIFDYFYSQLVHLFYMGEYYSKLAARVIMYIFLCIVLIINESYISKIAGIFMKHTTTSFKSPDDLHGAFLSSQEMAHNVLFQHDAYITQARPLTYLEDVHDEVSMFGIEGLAMDDPVAVMADKVFCDIHIELKNFFSADFGYMFNSNADERLLNTINRAIINVQNKYQSTYVEDYIENNYKKDELCQRKCRQDIIDIIEMRELWYIFLGFVGFSIIVIFIKILSKYIKQSKKKKQVYPEEIVGCKTSMCLNISEAQGELSARPKKDQTIADESIMMEVVQNSHTLQHDESEMVILEDTAVAVKEIDYYSPRITKNKIKTKEEINKDVTLQTNFIINNMLLAVENDMIDSFIENYWRAIYKTSTDQAI